MPQFFCRTQLGTAGRPGAVPGLRTEHAPLWASSRRR